MNNDEKIKILDEQGNEVEVKIINTIEVDNQEYLLFGTDKNEEEENIYAMKIIKTKSGEEDIIPITNEEEKKNISNIVNELMNN